MTEFSDGNQWHFITDPAAYERARLMYEMRAASGSTGQMLIDTKFAQQRAAMQPLLDGMLYYQKPYNKESPEAQATLFCDLIGHLAPNEMVMLDIEGDINVPDPADFMRRWCTVVEPRLNTLAWIYVPQSLSGGLTRAVTGTRIVKAPHYSAVPSWPHDVHQYTDNGWFPGANENGDVNRTELSVPQMLARCRRTVAPATPPSPPSNGPVITVPDEFPVDVLQLGSSDDGPRSMASIEYLAVHTNEPGDYKGWGANPGTVEGLISFCNNRANGASYQGIIDRTGKTGRCNSDGYIPWAAGETGNRRALHWCVLGWAAQSRAEWLAYPAQLDKLAQVYAFYCKARGWPVQKLTADDLRGRRNGICGHGEISGAYREVDHFDPGPNFPWDVVLDLTRKHLGIQSQAQRSAGDDDMTPEQDKMLREVHRELTLRLNDRSPGQDPISDTLFGHVLNAASFARRNQDNQPGARSGLIQRIADKLGA